MEKEDNNRYNKQVQELEKKGEENEVKRLRNGTH